MNNKPITMEQARINAIRKLGSLPREGSRVVVDSQDAVMVETINGQTVITYGHRIETVLENHEGDFYLRQYVCGQSTEEWVSDEARAS